MKVMLGNEIGKGTQEATRKHPGEAIGQRSHAVLVASLKDVIVSLERCDENGGLKKQFDREDFEGMRLSPLIIMNRKDGGLPQSVSTTTKSGPCYAVVLWSSTILEELNLHVKFENKLYTRLTFGKLLSEAVIEENPFMDWKEPFILVDVIEDQGAKITKGDLDNSIRIPVMEMNTADNWRIPTSRPIWELNVSQCCVKLGLEMLRRKPTIVMIWGARKTLNPDGSLIKGQIHLDSFFGPLNVVIFHGDEITEERRRAIQGTFSESELELFRDDFRRRIINNVITQKFAVHFSRPIEEPRPIDEKSGSENDDLLLDMEVESIMKFAATQELKVDDDSDGEG